MTDKLKDIKVEQWPISPQNCDWLIAEVEKLRDAYRAAH